MPATAGHPDGFCTMTPLQSKCALLLAICRLHLGGPQSRAVTLKGKSMRNRIPDSLRHIVLAAGGVNDNTPIRCAPRDVQKCLTELFMKRYVEFLIPRFIAAARQCAQ